MEVDFYRALPSDVTLHTARMYMVETTPEGEAAMLDDYLPAAIRDLASARPDVVVFGIRDSRPPQMSAEDWARRIELSPEPRITTLSSGPREMVSAGLHGGLRESWPSLNLRRN